MRVISRRINTAVRHLIEKDYENALIQISIALDSTTKKKWPKEKVGKRIRNFIEQYESFIYRLASSGGLIICNGGRIVIQGKELPVIIYKLVRCVLQHGDELADKIIIKENFNTLGVENGKIIINIGHIYGLLLAVVVDSVNKTERCESSPILILNGQKFIVNQLWGNSNLMI